MKFDFIIGNPPYQEETDNNGRQSPIYNLFMDEAYSIGECVELITPARFLFNAGQTPKNWNEKMLADKHFKVLEYESRASKVFVNTEIKGGVAISIRDTRKDFGEIGVFTEFDELNTILHKVTANISSSIADICLGGVPYAYTEKLKADHNEWISLMGDSFDLRTNAFEKLYGKVFLDEKRDGYIKIWGMYDKKRCFMYAHKEYIKVPENFTKYKVVLSKAQGSDKFGEALSKMIIAGPEVGHTQTFISMGAFDTEQEALNLEKYLKTKFARCMLSVLKKTQDITRYKWKYVPLQDYSNGSDINWNCEIKDIDQQLYKKYDLSDEEIEFIEKNVKEME